MAARQAKKKAEPGSVIPNMGKMEMDGPADDAGGNPEVKKEAKKRAAGGPVDGEAAKSRMDRPARKSGGRVGGSGSDKSPMSDKSSTSPFTSAGKC